MKDKRSIKDILEKLGILSINQTLAQIKLLEAWKACRDMSYLIELMKQRRRDGNKPIRYTRTTTRRKMPEGVRTILAENSLVRDTE